MALKRSQMLQIKRWIKGGFPMGTKKSWRLQGAVLVAGMGVLALGILVASRQPVPVTTTSAMEQAADSASDMSAAAKKARARRAENAVNTAVAPARNDVKPASDTGVVTISGCLEQDDDTFRLKDTEGLNAPKARSWKSGFLKKGTAKVEIVDASNRLRLQNHVGKRVSVTGQLHEKEMLASSVRRIASSCN
jgi:hypothetical protein